MPFTVTPIGHVPAALDPLVDRLVIAKRTADTHVYNALNTLGLSSRAQPLAYALAHGLRPIATEPGPEPAPTGPRPGCIG